MRKKLLVLLLALAMILSFAACGGGSGDSGGEAAPEEAAETAAEPNAGVGGIVMTIPDGWTMSEFYDTRNTVYSKEGSELLLGADCLTAAVLDGLEDSNVKTLEDFYNNYYLVSAENQQKLNIEAENIKVMDCDGSYIKRLNGDKGFSVLSTVFMCDDKIYEVYLSSRNAIDWSNEGKTREDAPVFSDEDIAMYENVVASIQRGDGEALASEQIAKATADSIGSMSFEAPAGYSVSVLSSDSITLSKEGSDIVMYINYLSPEGLKNIILEDGSHPTSIEDYYNDTYFFEGMDVEKIGGFDGYLNKYPDEDGKYYNIGGGFLADDGIYDFTMDANAYDWDNDGAIKEGAEALSDDDVAAFDNFVASLKKK